MAIKIDRALNKNDLRVGYCTLKCVIENGNPVWILPGGRKITDPSQAKKIAERFDAIIRYSITKSGKELI